MSLTLSTGLVVTKIPDLSDNTEEQKQHCNEWVEALRSGKYFQVRNFLKKRKDENSPYGFCCLGIGCEVASENLQGNWIQLAEPDHVAGYDSLYGTLEFQVFPESLISYYGMNSSQGFLVEIQSTDTRGLHRVNFTELNDGYEVTFSDIALILEMAINGGLST